MKDLSYGYLAGKDHFPAILLMHSLGDDCQVMQPLAVALNQAGYSVLTPTFTSHQAGDFEAICRSDYASYQADGVAALRWLKAQGAEEIFVGGLSLGGLVAIDLACQYPEIKGVLSLASPMFTDLNRTQVPYFIRQKYYASLGRVPTQSDRQHVTELFEVFKQSLSTINRWMDQVLPQVLQLETPVFVAMGCQDEVMQAEVARRLVRALKQTRKCELKLYESGTHYLVAATTLEGLVQDILHFVRACN